MKSLWVLSTAGKFDNPCGGCSLSKARISLLKANACQALEPGTASGSGDLLRLSNSFTTGCKFSGFGLSMLEKTQRTINKGKIKLA